MRIERRVFGEQNTNKQRSMLLGGLVNDCVAAEHRAHVRTDSPMPARWAVKRVAMAAGSLSSLPGSLQRVLQEIVHWLAGEQHPNAIAWMARIAVFIGEDSFGGGAPNGLSDFFAVSPELVQPGALR